MLLTLLGGMLCGILAKFFIASWLQGIGKALFVIGLVLIPAMFINMAYEYREQKNLAVKAGIFALIMLLGELPLLVKLCS